MFFAHIHVSLECFCTFRRIIARNNLNLTPYGTGDGRTFWRICVPDYTNFRHICPTAWSVHRAWIHPAKTGDKSIADGPTDKRRTCHAKGEVASNWIALRYACTCLSQGGFRRWQPKNLFTLVPLPEFKRGETEEDVAKPPK